MSDIVVSGPECIVSRIALTGYEYFNICTDTVTFVPHGFELLLIIFCVGIAISAPIILWKVTK